MLGTTGKRILLSIHILLNSIWIGGLAAMLFLTLARERVERGQQLYGTNLTVFLIHDAVVMNVGVGVVVTALLFSLFTKWGFFDFYWVIGKWIGLLVMFGVITFLLAPAVNGMVALSDLEGIHALDNPSYLQYQSETTLHSSILLLLLLFLIGLSVFKPWGPRKKQFATSRKTVLASGIGLGVVVIGAIAFQFVQLQEYRNMRIADVNLEKIADGTYVGAADFGFDFKVEVSVENHRISHIRVLENYNSVYARLAEGVTKKVLATQTLNVRAVTGATTTSKCLLKAMENAFDGKSK
jgi:uncharacterized protein with FMN-binding domain